MRTHAKHIALEKTKITLNLLRKSSLCFDESSSNEENPIISQMKSLQKSLRSGSTDELIDPIEIISPFVLLLRTPYLAGPFKAVALDAIQAFVSCNILSERPDRTGDTLAEVVDAVTRCKFVQTDPISDDLVQLRIVQVLQGITSSPVRTYLTDETAWDIVEACYNVLLQQETNKAALHQVAEQTLLDAVHFIFSCSPNDPDALSPLSAAPGVQQYPRASFGLPCAMKVLGYFVNTLQRYAVDNSYISNSQNANNNQTTHHQATKTSRPSLSRGQTPLIESELDPDTFELLLSLKTIHAMLLGQGNLNAPRDLILRCHPLAALVRDDLGRSLVLLSTKRDFPPVVLQNVLGVVSTLIMTLGPCLRILTECFFLHVYLKGVHQLQLMLKAMEEEYWERALSETYGNDNNNRSNSSAATAAAPQAALYTAGFCEEELEMILDSLCDLLSDEGFLPTLFASFDCDPTKPDIVSPLLNYIGQCSRIVLSLEGAELGKLKEAGNLAVQCLLQATQVLTHRGEEREERTGKPASPQYLTPVSSHRKSFQSLSQAAQAQAQAIGDRKLQVSSSPRVLHVQKCLRESRLSKEMLAEAAARFIEKPKLGLMYLQQEGALPTPLTPLSVAKFLRVAPGLPRENVGAFLGELGKDDSSFEADLRSFHEEVLTAYVQSFELNEMSLLNCMRIFLSAFRLPGEAQQIDRILVKFSEFCHDCCLEGLSGILENPEVAYLLSFSIIMLNTDLHNPNIKSERKMTLEQFIRNNTNYGADLKQTRSLSREFLESIYTSIAKFPIRTEKNDISGAVTPEVWMDMQLQAEINPEKSVMVTSAYSEKLLRTIAACLPNRSELSSPFGNANANGSASPMRGFHTTTSNDAIFEGTADTKDLCPAARVTRNLLTTNHAPDPIALSAELHGAHGVLDADLMHILWRHLLTVGICPFIIDRLGPRTSSTSPAASPSPSSAVPEALQGGARKVAPMMSLVVGAELLLSLLKLANYSARVNPVSSFSQDAAEEVSGASSAITTELQPFIELMPLLFADFAGFMKGAVVTSVCESLSLDIVFMPAAHRQRSSSSSASSSSPRSRAPPSSQELPDESSVTEYMDLIRTSHAARSSLSILLQILRNPPPTLNTGWSVLWYCLCTLRDFSLLPREVVVDAEGDLLPPQIRLDFEERIDLLAGGKKKVKTVAPRKVVSLLSFQGLGEAFFGTSVSSEEEGENVAENLRRPVVKRWDAGYEMHLEDDWIDAEDSLEEDRPDINALREIISECGVKQVVSDSRFLSESSLLAFLGSLLAAAEAKIVRSNARHLLQQYHLQTAQVRSTAFSSVTPPPPPPPAVSSLTNKTTTTTSSSFLNEPVSHSSHPITINHQDMNESIGELTLLLSRLYAALPLPGSSSIAWLEGVVVDAALRNRDRFSILWPTLSMHYKFTLSPLLEVHPSEPALPTVALQSDDIIVDFAAERRVVGLFKIATRMLGRRQACSPLLEFLGSIFCNPLSSSSISYSASAHQLHQQQQPQPRGAESRSEQGLNDKLKVNRRDQEGRDSENRYKGGSRYWWPMLEMASQVAMGMWTLLTMNVSVLPQLKLEQWQTTFDVIAVGADHGGFAAIKSFETMAWLIHEPRLRAEVPVFCVSGVRPLLRNLRCPVSVSVGGIHLLSHLHNRLEVLVSESGSEERLSIDLSLSNTDGELVDETPLLWESCWLPILQAMAEAATDSRLQVRGAAVAALTHALLDKHSLSVPATVLSMILKDVLAPVAVALGRLLESIARCEREGQMMAINGMKPGGTAAALRGEETSSKEQIEQEIKLLEMLAAGGDQVDSKASATASTTTSSFDRRLSVENNTPSVTTDDNNEISISTSTEAEQQQQQHRSGASPASLLLLSKALSDESHTADVLLKGGPAAECLSSLCKATLLQLKKLSPHSSFTRLWAALLNVLGFYLGAPSSSNYLIINNTQSDTAATDMFLHLAVGNENSIDTSLCTVSVELQCACESAREQLKNLLLVASSQGLFKDRPELWAMSCSAVEAMRECQGLMSELFPAEFPVTVSVSVSGPDGVAVPAHTP